MIHGHAIDEINLEKSALEKAPVLMYWPALVSQVSMVPLILAKFIMSEFMVEPAGGKKKPKHAR